MSRTLFITTAALALAAQPVRADVTLPAVFGDGMVLQTSPAVPVWGRAAPGERVTVAFAGRSATAAADPAGRWRLTLDLTPRPTAPADLTVVGDRTAAPRVFRDVAVGEVWLASGQSNMEKPVGPHPGQHPVDDWEKEVAGSADPAVRVFTVAKKASDRPLDDCGGRWEAASPATTARFTAAGYFFARELHRELRVPVGIIHASWGGTRAEAWTSPDGLAADPALAAPARAEADAYRNYPRALQQYRADVARWARANGCDDPRKAGHAVPAATEGWQPVALGAGKKRSVPAGVRWYRKDVAVPARWQGQAAFLVLGVVAGFDTAYVNGTRVGGVGPDRAEAVGSLRQYLVPAGLLKPGANTIAVRVHSHLPADAPVAQAWRVALAGKGPKVDLGGPWLARTETTFPPPGEAAVRAYPPAPPAVRHFDTAGFLFNGMIHPVIPYRLAGVVWYQGESNAAAPAGYGRAFPALINDWRSRWAAAGGAAASPSTTASWPTTAARPGGRRRAAGPRCERRNDSRSTASRTRGWPCSSTPARPRTSTRRTSRRSAGGLRSWPWRGRTAGRGRIPAPCTSL